MLLLGLVLLGIAYWRGSKRWMRIFAAMILACALAGIATRVVKISTGRARPNVQTEAEWNGPSFSPRYNAFPVRAHRGLDRIFRDAGLRVMADRPRIAGDPAADRVFANVRRGASSIRCRVRSVVGSSGRGTCVAR